MRFTCDSCRAQYMISDDKVGAKGVKVRCKKCGHNIVVKPHQAQLKSAFDSAVGRSSQSEIREGEIESMFDSILGHPRQSPLIPPPQQITPPSDTQGHVFISYSHKDKKWLDKLHTHLKPLLRAKTLTIWSDEQIKAGADWRQEIETALHQSKVAVLIVSANFIASDFVVQNELSVLLNRAGTRVLWVPVSDCSYESIGIDKYQAVISPNKPLNRIHHAHVDRTLVKICREIQQAYNAPAS